MLEGLQSIDDKGTSASCLAPGCNTGQGVPGDHGAGAEKRLQPQLQSCGQMDGAPGKLSSKGLPSITVRRGSLEKDRKGSSSGKSRTPEAKREGRSSVSFGEQIMGKPATPGTRKSPGLQQHP